MIQVFNCEFRIFLYDYEFYIINNISVNPFKIFYNKKSHELTKPISRLIKKYCFHLS